MSHEKQLTPHSPPLPSQSNSVKQMHDDSSPKSHIVQDGKDPLRKPDAIVIEIESSDNLQEVCQSQKKEEEMGAGHVEQEEHEHVEQEEQEHVEHVEQEEEEENGNQTPNFGVSLIEKQRQDVIQMEVGQLETTKNILPQNHDLEEGQISSPKSQRNRKLWCEKAMEVEELAQIKPSIQDVAEEVKTLHQKQEVQKKDQDPVEVTPFAEPNHAPSMQMVSQMQLELKVHHQPQVEHHPDGSRQIETLIPSEPQHTDPKVQTVSSSEQVLHSAKKQQGANHPKQIGIPSQHQVISDSFCQKAEQIIPHRDIVQQNPVRCEVVDDQSDQGERENGQPEGIAPKIVNLEEGEGEGQKPLMNPPEKDKPSQNKNGGQNEESKGVRQQSIEAEPVEQVDNRKYITFEVSERNNAVPKQVQERPEKGEQKESRIQQIIPIAEHKNQEIVEESIQIKKGNESPQQPQAVVPQQSQQSWVIIQHTNENLVPQNAEYIPLPPDSAMNILRPPNSPASHPQTRLGTPCVRANVETANNECRIINESMQCNISVEQKKNNEVFTQSRLDPDSNNLQSPQLTDIHEIRKVLLASLPPNIREIAETLHDNQLREMYLEIRAEEAKLSQTTPKATPAISHENEEKEKESQREKKKSKKNHHKGETKNGESRNAHNSVPPAQIKARKKVTTTLIQRIEYFEGEDEPRSKYLITNDGEKKRKVIEEADEKMKKISEIISSFNFEHIDEGE